MGKYSLLNPYLGLFKGFEVFKVNITFFGMAWLMRMCYYQDSWNAQAPPPIEVTTVTRPSSTQARLPSVFDGPVQDLPVGVSTPSSVPKAVGQSLGKIAV